MAYNTINVYSMISGWDPIVKYTIDNLAQNISCLGIDVFVYPLVIYEEVIYFLNTPDLTGESPDTNTSWVELGILA